MNSTWKIIAVLVCAALPAAASDFKVIANSSVTAATISPEDLKSIFLTTKTALSDGHHVEPVLLRSGSVHETFVRHYVGRTAIALQNYYRSLVFAGKGIMPKMLASDEEVVAYVSRTKGAIGYVSPHSNVGGLKILQVK